MNNLQPEVRLAKNGRAVTKHVRSTPKTSKGFLARIKSLLDFGVPSLTGGLL